VRRTGMRAFARNRRNKHFVWSALFVSGATPFENNIVPASDWPATVGLDEATLLRIRGSFSCYADTTAPDIAAYIAVFDKDVTAPSPLAVTTYVEEDVLWTWTGSIWAVATGAGEASVRCEIDVKAKRRLDVEGTVQLEIGTTAAEGVLLASFSFRCLFLVP